MRIRQTMARGTKRRWGFATALEGLEPRMMLCDDTTIALDSSPVFAAAPQPLAAMMAAPAIVGPAFAPDAAALEADHLIMADGPSASHIILQHDKIPNFAANPTILSVRSGKWTDPAVWSLGRLPIAGDVVQIAAGTTIEYAIVSDAPIKAIGVNPGATLKFSTTVNTRLTVGTLIVFEGGTLQVGSAAKAISSARKAEIVFADLPLDLNRDPKQYGNGLLGFGTVEFWGATKNLTWTRLAREPRAGDTYLELESTVVGWRPGDSVFLPDSRQIPPHMARYIDAGAPGIFDPQWETPVIGSVIGNRLYLAEPLRYDHVGARNADGQLELLPHVALLDRNIVVRSANPSGTRGHVLLGGRANVTIRYTQFHDLGRTTNEPLDNTTVDASGTVTHVGTNQIGRYSLHMHHLVGPENPTNTGYQFRLVGNTIDNGGKWGLALHGTSFGYVGDNVVLNVQGAGIVTEEGSEIQNDIYRNFIARVSGTGVESNSDVDRGDTGRSGAGFWFHRAGNVVGYNVVADVAFSGLVINGRGSQNQPLPAFRGALREVEGEYITLDDNPGGTIKDVEVYGRTQVGVWMSFPTGQSYYSSDLLFRRLRIWHIHTTGVDAYHVGGLVFDDLRVFGDRSILGIADANSSRPTIGVRFSRYEAYNISIRNSRIENQYVGIIAPESSGGFVSNGAAARPMLIESTVLANFVNIRVPTAKYDALQHRRREIEINDTLFRGVDTTGFLYSPEATFDIEMQYLSPLSNATRDLMAFDSIKVRNYNRVSGDSFQVYYFEQRAGFVPPATPGEGGSPLPGRTNQELWDTLGVAVGGAVAECETSRYKIWGYTCALPVRGTIAAGASPAADELNRQAAIDIALAIR